ncbi:MAG: hypothetical protein BGO67_10040 [Alphaproteobacteria bacterium 41-28]|nr:MAG: hypothetical protein BGO67_10040 [Alphaproteobacteria bacterium 41-28]
MSVGKAYCPYTFLKFTTVLFISLFLLSKKDAISMMEDNIYNDPGILRIYVQHPVLKTISIDLKEGLENFTQLSAHKQQKFLKEFELI